MDKGLLRRPDPDPDESMIGYLLRLSDDNCYESLNPILWLLGEKDFDVRASRIRAICTGNLNIERLAYLTKRPKTVFDSLVFQPVFHHRNLYINVGRASISDELMNFKRPAVCVQCLAESFYHRKIWTIATYTVCLKHLTLLQDTCSVCGWVFNWSKTNLLKCHCDVELNADVSKQVDSSETMLARMTAQAVSYNTISGHPLITDMQSLYAVTHLGYMLSSRYPWSDAELNLSRQITSVRHSEILDAFKPFANWPESFHQYLTELVCRLPCIQ